MTWKQDADESVGEATRQAMSACMDGHGEVHELEAVCVAWRANAEDRATWHAYHLIGDVLRSDELAVDPVHDEAFVQGLRLRLAGEQRALPMRSIETPTRARWTWAVAAVAAGFVAVASVLMVTRQVGQEPSSMNLEATSELLRDSDLDRAGIKGKLVRDAELERYFAAHRRVTLGSSVVMPGAVVRNVEAVSIEDR